MTGSLRARPHRPEHSPSMSRGHRNRDQDKTTVVRGLRHVCGLRRGSPPGHLLSRRATYSRKNLFLGVEGADHRGGLDSLLTFG